MVGDQTHLGHHKPTHLGHHQQETHLEHHISTHLGHHRQHFCERVVTGGHSLRSPTQAYYIPLGLDMGTWGLGDMGRDMGTWGLGDMVRSIGSHTNTFRVRHGDMGFRGHGGHGSFYWITYQHL